MLKYTLKASEVLDADFVESEVKAKLHEKVWELLGFIIQEGFNLTLVGGAVRDFLLTGQFSKDLDFELRHPYEYNGEDWTFRLRRLGERIREEFSYDLELLSFGVVRIPLGFDDLEVELASARLEDFSLVKGKGHSDVDIILVSNLPYKDTFNRRDFTLNALGIEFSQGESGLELRFIDPFGGFEDLTNKRLVPCGDNFSKDPVRLCRAIRFALKFDLEMSEKLKEQFPKMTLKELSPFYFFREGLKVDFFKFTHRFYELVSENGIPTGDAVDKLSFLGQVGSYNLDLKKSRSVLEYLIYHEDIDTVKMEDLENFCLYGNLKNSLIDLHLNFKSTLEELSSFEWDKFSKDIIGMSFDDFLKYEFRGALKRFHIYRSRYEEDERFTLLGRINSKLYTTFLKSDKYLSGELKGRHLFQERMNDIDPSKRSDLLYYCHFLELFS